MEPQDRRKAVRMDLAIPIVAEYDDEAGRKAQVEMLSRDVSHTGAFLVGDWKAPLETVVRLVMNLGKLVVKAVARVVRVEETGFAVVFSQTMVTEVA